MAADGMTPAEIVAELPDLALGVVAEALHYAAEAVKERELPLQTVREVPRRREPVGAFS